MNILNWGMSVQTKCVSDRHACNKSMVCFISACSSPCMHQEWASTPYIYKDFHQDLFGSLPLWVYYFPCPLMYRLHAALPPHMPPLYQECRSHIGWHDEQRCALQELCPSIYEQHAHYNIRNLHRPCWQVTACKHKANHQHCANG